MNREIKFRGININRGKRIWVYGSLIKYNIFNEDYFYISGYKQQAISASKFNLSISSVPVIPETVSQFIGLQNKNGIDIYEEDIIHFIYCPESLKCDLTGIVCKDKFQNWCIKISDEEYTKHGFTGNNEFHIENAIKGIVIGNIHDNKDLIKK